jgi:hypothetical protein
VKCISTESLRSSDVPSLKETWCAIEQFALTFKGYDWAGSFEKCAELANSTRETYDDSKERHLPRLTSDELRACLYFEQRRSHHSDYTPEGEDLLYIRALLERIREVLTTRELPKPHLTGPRF